MVKASMFQSANLMVNACLLSLASNIEPSKHLAFAQQHLAKLGKVVFSEISVSDNLSPSDCPVYHNQVVYIALATPMDYFRLVELTKHVEQQAHRNHYQKPLVTLDIDIVAIYPEHNKGDGLDEKGEPFIKFEQLPDWLGVTRRFPLADYDAQGLKHLAQLQHLQFLTYFLS